MLSLSALRAGERPRERMIRLGARALDDVELLALVLGTGRGSGEDALQLAERLLIAFKGLVGLAEAPRDALEQIVGIGPVKATRILAAFEVGRRVEEGPSDAPEPVDPIALLRGQISPSEQALLGYRPGRPTLSLALGETLCEGTRLGTLLARLIAEGEGPWWLVSLRPGEALAPEEAAAARRLLAAAALIGLDLPKVVIAGNQARWRFEGEGAS
ncbi:hypothetical protein KKF91_21475 [Myxococcota bacterium]|nr:hypothetical protein [Myxococcota bacterium]MBU1433117.1 hypothetical protein [Myxococcota bacterium]MBU1900046.1 hypothetical protein [Myxococcota bacterium]